MKNDEQVHPFAIVPAEVVMDTRLTLETMRVLVTLFSFRNKVTGLTFPSREAISERCGMHPSNISEATKKLVDLGWLSKDGKGGYSKTTKYTITIPEEVSEMAEKHKARSDARKAKVAEQTTVAQSATVAEQATRKGSPVGYSSVAEQATRKGSPVGYTQVTDHLTDQLTDNGLTHTGPGSEFTPTKAGSCCQQMRVQGIPECNPSHPTLLALIEAGATEDEFSYAARQAVEKGNPKFSYVIGIVRKQREDAAKLVLHKGRLPNKQEALEQSNRAATEGWMPPELRGVRHAN